MRGRSCKRVCRCRVSALRRRVRPNPMNAGRAPRLRRPFPGVSTPALALGGRASLGSEERDQSNMEMVRWARSDERLQMEARSSRAAVARWMFSDVRWKYRALRRRERMAAARASRLALTSSACGCSSLEQLQESMSEKVWRSKTVTVWFCTDNCLSQAACSCAASGEVARKSRSTAAAPSPRGPQNRALRAVNPCRTASLFRTSPTFCSIFAKSLPSVDPGRPPSCAMDGRERPRRPFSRPLLNLRCAETEVE
mmetsp:Transcript_13550/g.38556  ORF Transcript_13550/g.38556 Transcript_13550/m.38556 type:complete len:254 (+) Transcript_13550:3914-4675(+)